MLKLAQRYFLSLGTVVLFCFLAGQAWAADSYSIDEAHSSFGFTVKHLMVSTVRGEFTDYSGTIQFDPQNLADSKIDVTIQAASIDTRVANRDSHLRSVDFFEVEKFPTITFQSTKISEAGGKYEMVGDLTIHGVTKTVTIPASISGPVTSPMGDQVIGLSAEFILNRQDYGVKWNKAMDNGGVVVDDMVNVIVNIEAHKK